MMADIRVLIVDDEEFYLRLFGDILAARRLHVKTARGGEEALALLKRERFDILITDLLMEGLDGLVLTEKVRNTYPWVDIVVITQRDDVRLAVRTMRMGVFEYLVKPVDRDELLLTVDRLLERRKLLDLQNKLVDESIEYLQAQTIYRRCLDILSTLDFENLCEVILRHMIQATGAQGGLLWLTSPEERSEVKGNEKLNLAAYRGLVTLDDFPLAISLLPGVFMDAFRNGQPFFTNPGQVFGSADGGSLSRALGRQDREALFIPLTVDELPVGLLLLLDKLREDFSERDLNITRTMAQFSAIGLKNSRRFQALERVGLRDQGSTAYNLTYFVDYAGKEIYKARRYGRNFSLVNVMIDRFEFLQEHFKSEVCHQMSRKLAESISRVVRDSDILARVSDHEYYVLLPETDSLGARMFVRRCQETFSTDPFIDKMSQDYPIGVTMGVATYPLDGKDFDELLLVCRREMELARNSLFRRLGLKDKGFWEVVRILVGRPEDYERPLEAASPEFRLAEDLGGSNAHGMFSDILVEWIEEEVAKQTVDFPARKAILYDIGGELDSEQRPVERSMANAEKARAFVLGRRGKGTVAPDYPSVTRIFLDDEPIEAYRILLALGEHLSYAFLGAKKNQHELYGFHTHDHYLVENLIAKVQEHYNLQRKF